MVYDRYIYIILPNGIGVTTKIFQKNIKKLCNFKYNKRQLCEIKRKVTKFLINEKTQIRKYVKKIKNKGNAKKKRKD